MNGQLQDHPLAELIREISAKQLSGALRLERERVRAVVYFDAGTIVAARSNLRPYRLAECLRRWGVVTEERIGSIVTETMTDAEAASSLVAVGALDAGDLDKLLARQTSETLRPMLLWTDGQWAFDPRVRPNERVAAVDGETPQLLSEAARRLPGAYVAARLKDSDEIISPATGAPDNLQLLPGEAFVLSRVDAPARLCDIVSLSGMPEPDTLHAIYVLALGGLLSRANWPEALTASALAAARSKPTTAKQATASAATSQADNARAAKEPEAPADPRAELDELFARASGATHYEVLGMTRSASGDDIKRAYYALAKRFHPDRFHKDAGDELRSRIESSFARVARAYEVLKDSRQRATYDLKLEEQARQQSAPPGAGVLPLQSAVSNAPSSHASERASSAPPSPIGGGNGASSVEREAEESFRQGLDALAKGNQVLALACLSKAAQTLPKEARYRAHYGRALARESRTRRQGEAELQAAIALDSRNASYRVMLAELYRDVGLRRRAVGELEHALAADPRHEPARRMLEELRRAG